MERITDILLIVIAFSGAFLAALWLAMVIWTFRDIRSRTRDIFAQILAALVVAILNLPGLLIYFILRPPETLAESYTRSLEEEALLQGIEEADVCPGCGQRVLSEFIVCPTCHTKLKKPCVHCGRAIHLRWTVCPYCGTASVAAGSPTPSPTASVTQEPRRAKRGDESPAPTASA
jgi:Double zinc ribbon